MGELHMKKLLLVSIMFLMFAGVVSASSINGDYKGNPIVKLKSNGNVIDSGEVPAMIYDGKTLVPIAALRNLGATVTWDADTYSVDVKMPTPKPDQYNDLAQVIIGFNKKAPEYNASNVKMIFNDLGGYISADVIFTGNADIDAKNIMLTSSFVANSPAALIFINMYKNNTLIGYYSILRTNVEAVINNLITVDSFIKTWEWKAINNSNVSTQITTPSTPVVKIDNTQACNNIQYKYYVDVQETIESFANRGLLYSGGLQAQKDNLRNIANGQLAALGCTQIP